MREFIGRLTRYLVCMARAAEPEIDTVLDPQSPRSIYDHDNYGNVSYVFLALYLTKHPSNPYFGQPVALETYTRLVDGWVRKWEASAAAGSLYRFPEWPIFIMCRGLELVGGELDASLRQRIEKVVAHFVDRDLRRPFFFTAPNHEAWKLVDAALAGRVLGRPDWREQGEFEAGQLLAWQTPEGFWEEGRHHGPSMSYNFTMVAAMAVLAKELDNPRLRAAAARLAQFMSRWTFPDGTTVGAFDGRKPTVPGRVAPGMELAPEGLTYMKRAMEFWDRRGWLDPANIIGPISRQPMKGDWIAAEALLYYSDLARGGEPATDPLPCDADGATLENHTPYFDAVAARRGPWMAALSSQLSDVPKDTQFIYRLERQNRIEIWHRRSSVVIGGGHNVVTAKYPLYNAWVEPGYHAEPSGFSHTGGPASTPEMARRRSKYYPRATASGTSGDVFWLELVFAHATVRFEIEPTGAELAVRYSYQSIRLEQLRVALPMLLWDAAKGFADGRELELTPEPTEVEVERDVVVECSLFGTKATLSVPEAGDTRVLFPLAPMQSYREPAAQRVPGGFFWLALVETVLDEPGRSGSGEWRLRVE